MNIARIAVFILALAFPIAASSALPNPILVLTGTEVYESNGQQWLRYKYAVFNRTNFPNDMFAPAPDLPPCGSNVNSSRTWVDFFDQQGKRLYGFCALGNSEALAQLWFALPVGEIPPSWIYVEMTDRKSNTKYKSNLAETAL